MLYNSSFLHQTTTRLTLSSSPNGCIILLFYIKPQLEKQNDVNNGSCIILLFYIKPQPMLRRHFLRYGCIILLFYIKPQHEVDEDNIDGSCIILLFYIKPQQNEPYQFGFEVV